VPTELYLDTARFGLATRGALRAQLDYVRLSAGSGGSRDVEELLLQGFDAWPKRLQYRYGGLADWRGITRLKESLRSFAGAPGASDVLLANRSAQLMKLAARALFLRCRKVLHTDLEWPGYLALLDEERRRTKGELLCLPVRSAVYREKLSARELTALAVRQYRRQGCDGLFLSSVTFQGARLPVLAILECLSRGTPPRLVVVDGAQAFAHVPEPLADMDLYLAGCHKWLRAGHPLGIAFAPRLGSAGFLRATREEMVRAGELDDPLLSFSEGVEEKKLEAFTETVDVAPLFPTAAVVSGPGAGREGLANALAARVDNAEVLAEIARSAGWRPLLADLRLYTGILLLEARSPAVQSAPPDEVRAAFQEQRISLTTYGGGILRVCVPERAWEARELNYLRTALRRLA
jgi:hypothetical protein